MADVIGVLRSQLVITFKTDGGTSTLNIPNPRNDVSEADIKALADHVVANGYIKSSTGDDLTAVVKAKVVASDTDKFDLV